MGVEEDRRTKEWRQREKSSSGDRRQETLLGSFKEVFQLIRCLLYINKCESTEDQVCRGGHSGLVLFHCKILKRNLLILILFYHVIARFTVEPLVY